MSDLSVIAMHLGDRIPGIKFVRHLFKPIQEDFFKLDV